MMGALLVQMQRSNFQMLQDVMASSSPSLDRAVRDPITLTFPPSRRRSLSSTALTASPATSTTSRGDLELMKHSAAAGHAALPPSFSPPPSADEVQDAAETSDEAPGLASTGHSTTTPATRDEQRVGDTAAPKAGAGQLLDALMERDRDRVAKRKADAAVGVCKKPAAAVKAPVAKPRFFHDSTRSRYICKTGESGAGSTHAFKYGPGQTCRTPEEARVASMQWVERRILDGV